MICAAALCIFAAIDLRAVDGDTVAHGERSFRIWGINASERGASDYADHKRLMADVLSSATILQCVDRGYATTSRGSWQCVVTGGPYDGQDIGMIMCSAGYAVDVPRFSDGYYRGCGE